MISEETRAKQRASASTPERILWMRKIRYSSKGKTRSASANQKTRDTWIKRAKFVSCQQCGEQFRISPCRLGIAKFCSVACHNQSMRKTKQEKLLSKAVSREAYRARKTGAVGSYSLIEWESLKKDCNYACLCCGKIEPEIMLTADHILPLSKGGDNTIRNIQPLCRSCNSMKSTQKIDFRSGKVGDRNKRAD